ncbi:MAG: hypothetical protein WBL72_17580 [Thermoguttaceae bacterium]
MANADELKRQQRLIEQRRLQEQQERELREQQERYRKAAQESPAPERADLDRLLSDIEGKPDQGKPKP